MCTSANSGRSAESYDRPRQPCPAARHYARAMPKQPEPRTPPGQQAARRSLSSVSILAWLSTFAHPIIAPQSGPRNPGPSIVAGSPPVLVSFSLLKLVTPFPRGGPQRHRQSARKLWTTRRASSGGTVASSDTTACRRGPAASANRARSGRATQTGAPKAPARCAIDVSDVTTKSRLRDHRRRIHKWAGRLVQPTGKIQHRKIDPRRSAPPQSPFAG